MRSLTVVLAAACLLNHVAGVGLKAAQARREAQKSWPTKTDFLKRLTEGSGGSASVAYIFDVGANDGAWTREMLRLSSARGLRVVPVLVEPQPFFADSLRQLAQRHGGAFHSAAAWTSNGGSVTLQMAKDSRAASVGGPSNESSTRGGDGGGGGGTHHLTVPTIDAVQLLRSALVGNTTATGMRTGASPPPLAYLHLDVEGGESTLLPPLLLSGVLCLLTHVHIEWHLPNLATDSEALVGTAGLRLAFEHLLHRGCAAATAPQEGSFATNVMVDHEESKGSAVAYRIARRAAYSAFGKPPMPNP